MFRNKVIWSPCEIEGLQKNKDILPIDQLTIYLGKSRSAIQRKLKEIETGVTTVSNGKRSNIGKRKDLGIFCRSAWEANICRWLTYTCAVWLYEPKVFVFEKERRGAISYLPDIYIPAEDIYIEVKGYLDSRGRSAIKKFKQYYPDEFKKLRYITGSANTKASKFFEKMGVPVLCYYNDLNKKYKDEIPSWE